jgi:hypothetical protein
MVTERRNGSARRSRLSAHGTDSPRWRFEPFWRDGVVFLTENRDAGQPMSRIKFLREQIERAKRFAAGMTNSDDRGRLEAAANKYQRELDALSSPDAKSADTSRPFAVADATTPDAAAPSDAIAATDDAAPTTSGDTGQQETD